MCGVFGFATKKGLNVKTEDLSEALSILFKLSETRGKDASGIAIQTKNKIFVHKASVAGSTLIKSNEYKRLIKKTLTEASDSNKLINSELSAMGHARMETNGSFTKNYNNQPVIKDGIVTIHNGIIVNEQKLWEKHKSLKRMYQVDTEIINALLKKFLEEKNTPVQALRKVFRDIQGSASLGIFFDSYNILALATNTGSLYTAWNQEQNLFVFSSELFILNSLLTNSGIFAGSHVKAQQLRAGSGLLIDLQTLRGDPFQLNNKNKIKFNYNQTQSKKGIILTHPQETEQSKEITELLKRNDSKETKRLINDSYKHTIDAIRKIKKCSKCILPETMPFISFNKEGVCNYCLDYRKKELKGESALRKKVLKYKKNNGQPDCMICLSGGRDSSYALHYVKKVLNMNPIAYSYDWGMLTDLGRRNQARMCAELGVEHILVAADITKKREYIRLNVEAWLKKPKLGMVPLFMAGDKAYFYYVNQIKKNNNIDLVIMGENYFEKTAFKNGFAGVKQKGLMAYHISILEKLHLLLYYLIQYITNPSYLNVSFKDSLKAFFSYFILPHKYLNIYDYIRWDENVISKTLIGRYHWETVKGFKSTWRIGDGTAAFYNYIYYTVAGFSEFDTFRSNQIREGVITRESALELINEENKPKPELIKWYCDTIKVEIDKATKIINNIPKTYSQVLRKNVLVLTSTFPRWKNDATPPFVYELEKKLVKDFEIHILAPHYQGAKKEEMMEGLRVYRFQYFWPSRWQKLCDTSGILPNLKLNKLLYVQIPTLILFELINAIKLIKKEKISLIHAHWIIPQGIIACLIFRLYKIPYVITSHGGDTYGLSGKLFTWIKKIIVKNAEKVTVVSRAIGKEIETKVSKDLPVEIIPMGVDLKLFNLNKKDEDLKKKYNITGPSLFFVGTLTEKKGVKYLIRAMSKIIDKFPKIKLLIIGSGTLDKPLKKLTKDLFLTNNVIFLGGIPNRQLPKYYATADILVIPSIKTELGDVEGIPVVLMEGLASGKAIVTSNVGGVPEIITHNINGIFVPEKDIQLLAQSIIEVLCNNKLKLKLERGAKESSKKYDLKIIAEKFNKIYSVLYRS